MSVDTAGIQVILSDNAAAEVRKFIEAEKVPVETAVDEMIARIKTVVE